MQNIATVRSTTTAEASNSSIEMVDRAVGNSNYGLQAPSKRLHNAPGHHQPCRLPRSTCSQCGLGCAACRQALNSGAAHDSSHLRQPRSLHTCTRQECGSV